MVLLITFIYIYKYKIKCLQNQINHLYIVESSSLDKHTNDINIEYPKKILAHIFYIFSLLFIVLKCLSININKNKLGRTQPIEFDDTEPTKLNAISSECI